MAAVTEGGDTALPPQEEAYLEAGGGG